MPQKRTVYAFETVVPGIEVSGIITDQGALYIQIRDNQINDALWSEYFDSPVGAISEAFAKSQLEMLAKAINEKTFKNLYIKYLFEKYKFYVERGWASDFKDFQQKFFKEMNIEAKEQDANVQ